MRSTRRGFLKTLSGACAGLMLGAVSVFDRPALREALTPVPDRILRAEVTYSVEAVQDLLAYHGIDAVGELQRAAAWEIARKMDAEILQALGVPSHLLNDRKVVTTAVQEHARTTEFLNPHTFVMERRMEVVVPGDEP